MVREIHVEPRRIFNAHWDHEPQFAQVVDNQQNDLQVHGKGEQGVLPRRNAPDFPRHAGNDVLRISDFGIRDSDF